jgi:Protein of unknown function (DUF3010).
MKVLGIDFDSNKACFVMVNGNHEQASIQHRERIQLTETRSQKDMTAFRDGVRTILEQCAPEKVAIRAKPESGQMRAGAAALKMEAIILAEATAPIEFVSSAAVSKQEDAVGLFAYLQPAFKVAMAQLARSAKRK